MSGILSGTLSLFTATWTTDPDLRFTSCAGNALASHDLQPNFFVGKMLPEILPGAAADPAVAAHRRALAGETVTFEEGWRGRVYRARVEPRRDAKGRTVGVSGIAVDVTQEKLVEEAVGASERRYRQLFEGSPLPMWVFDAETLAFKAVNDAAVRHYGYSREEFLSRTLRDVRLPEDVAALERAVATVRLRGWPAEIGYVGRWRHRKKDGSVIFMDVHSAPTPEGFIAILQDVTERLRIDEEVRRAREDLERRVEERTRELQASEERLRRLADEQGLLLTHTRDFLYRHDVRGVFNYLSPAVEAVTGHPVQEWLAHYTRFMTDNPINQKVVEYTERTLRTGEQSPAYLVEVRRRDGRPILLEVSERAYREDGEIAGIVGVARDVTEREQAQEQVRQAADATRRAYAALKRTQNRLIEAEKLASMGMVMAGVAHEINNPLNVMYGNLHLLRDEWGKGNSSDRSRTARMLSDAMKAAEDAKIVVEEFRHFARDSSAAEPTDLRDCVEEAIEHAKPLFGRRVRIVRKLGRVAAIRLHRGQIRRAIQNMIKNAVEAIDGRGRVTVTVARRGRSAVVEVEDTGRGIAPENLARLFEPFFTTKEPGRGFGLGLAMCAAVAQKHGGRITVKSRPGRGARFTLRLPSKK